MLQHIAKRIRLCERRIVETIGAEQRVLVGKFLIGTKSEEIFVNNDLTHPRKVPNIPVDRGSGGGQRCQSEIGSNRRVHRDWSSREVARPRSRGEYLI